MKRIDAEQRSSPLHPRETTKGVEPTPSSGKKSTRRGRVPKAIVEISQDIRETSNFWTTSYDILIAKVRGQLEERLKIIPSNRLPFKVDPEENFHIIVATGNDIKAQEIVEATQRHVKNCTIHREPKADEIHKKVTHIDAYSKAKDAIQLFREHHPDVSENEPTISIATDQLNFEPIVKPGSRRDGLRTVEFRALGKPNAENLIGTTVEEQRKEMLEGIKRTFKRMAKLAKDNQWETIPFIQELSTVLINPVNPKDKALSKQRSATFLNPTMLRYLATPKGFEEYVKTAKQLGVDITATAGGFSYEAFAALGLTKFVTGTAEELPSTTFPPQRPDAQDHASRIALGRIDRWLLADYFNVNKEELAEATSRASQTRRGTPNQSSFAPQQLS